MIFEIKSPRNMLRAEGEKQWMDEDKRAHLNIIIIFHSNLHEYMAA